MSAGIEPQRMMGLGWGWVEDGGVKKIAIWTFVLINLSDDFRASG